MMLMCPVDKFLLLLKDYPQTYKWMMQRSLIRRNYFKEIRNVLYARHDVESIFNHPRYAGRKLSEEEEDCLCDKIYKSVSRNSSKISMNPFDLDIREMLTDDSICELDVGPEIEDKGAQESIFA